METLKGYAGNILKVNLTTGDANQTPTAPYADLFVGGRGLAAKLYWEDVPPEIDAYDPENRLIFATGPISASTKIAGSRWQVCGKSPIHDLFSFCNMGGVWGAQLKFAGYDALVVHGKADKPVYLFIEDDQIEIRDAADLMGKGAIATREILKERLGKAYRVVTIGPAGENKVTFSILLADMDASGSSGLASVMGSKNLKAIVVKGSKKIEAADPDKVKQLGDRISEMTHRPSAEVIANSPNVPKEKLKRDLCWGCKFGCMRASYEGESGKKGKYICHTRVFYETRAMRYYGEWNEVGFEANKLCDDYGIESYNLEAMIGWLVRCARAKIITEEQTGLPLSAIGSLEFIEKLIRMISLREGFGDLLAKGVHKAAEALGKEAQDQITHYISRTGYNPIYGARLYITTGFFWAMEPRLPIQLLHEVSVPGMRWAVHAMGGQTGMTSDVIREIGRRFWGGEIAADFSTYEGKAKAAAVIQDREYAKESLIICDFLFPIFTSAIDEKGVGDPTIENQLYEAVTGRPMDEEGLYKIGQRVYNLQRAIHIREGRKAREADVLEEYNYTTPLKSDFGNPDCLVPGPNGEKFSRKGMVIDRDKFEEMKDEYYEIRGWDVKTGLQTKAALEALDLGDVAREMEQKGLLA
jgi:aldehyde:ferredoxin oxidoreductase